MTECPYSRRNPFSASLKANFRINKLDSGKDTRHIVFDLKGSGLTYQAGDSLGVFAKNPPSAVEEFLEKLELDGSTPIQKSDDVSSTLYEELFTSYTLNRANKKFVKAIFEKTSVSDMSEEALTEYIFSRDYVDILNEHPKVRFTAEELLPLLTSIVPRLYSIASSPKKHSQEVHLTLAVVAYSTHGRDKLGLASGYMAEYVAIGETAPVFVQSNPNFRLPENPDVPIIMVGPGTGIAPLRAFLQEREVEGAKGKNWLFFGDRKRSCDFLYEEEIEAWQRQGFLTRLSTAFSRDQEYKIYVQDRICENSAEIWAWLQEGAHFYVCGDKRMGRDVHQALLKTAQDQGGMDFQAAEEFFNNLKAARRYQRDVY